MLTKTIRLIVLKLKTSISDIVERINKIITEEIIEKINICTNRITKKLEKRYI
tara:strand:+ start:356 stop:514 length:159 start_codon:yes stop_codon:yes gene_type:complete